jgi:hypothetical protein
MHRYSILFLLWLVVSCSSTRKLKTDKETGLPLARKLSQLDSVQEGMLRGRSGVLFHAVRAEAADEMEDAEEAADDCKSRPKECTDPSFRGSDRRDAKLSFNKKNQKDPESLKHLVARLMKSDEAMHTHVPKISLACNSLRLPEEMENVFLEHVYVYVILREADGDYHLIVGNGTDSTSDMLMGVEISALPETTSPYYNKLKQVRDKFERKHKTCSRLNLWEKRKKNALPEISVKGTLFYDMGHSRDKGKKQNYSGDKTIKTGTYWEIHPATYIKFWN